MAYSVKSDMLEQINEDDLILLTDEDDLGTVNEDTVKRAIADADAEIDAYCGVRYDVPLSPVPAMIRKVSVDIAIFNLTSRRERVSDDRKKRYDNAIKFLQSVAAGQIWLGTLDAESPSEHQTPAFSGNTRVFTKSGMEGW